MPARAKDRDVLWENEKNRISPFLAKEYGKEKDSKKERKKEAERET